MRQMRSQTASPPTALGWGTPVPSALLSGHRMELGLGRSDYSIKEALSDKTEPVHLIGQTKTWREEKRWRPMCLAAFRPHTGRWRLQAGGCAGVLGKGSKICAPPLPPLLSGFGSCSGEKREQRERLLRNIPVSNVI